MNQNEIKAFIAANTPTDALISSWNDGTHSEVKDDSFGSLSVTGNVTKFSLLTWKNSKGVRHRPKGVKPAEMAFYEDGSPYYLCWFNNGEAKNYIEWNKDGEVAIFIVEQGDSVVDFRRVCSKGEIQYQYTKIQYQYSDKESFEIGDINTTNY